MNHSDPPLPEHRAGAVTRRDILGMFPALAGLPLIGRFVKRSLPRLRPACVVVPQQTEGPYFADVGLDRSDIRTDPSDGAACAGVPLWLEFNVSRVSEYSCAPLSGAMVDIWQCDAHGRYSAFRDSRAGFDLRDKQFLRGHQMTDPQGSARFVTIFPGLYRGRTIHIHFKIRTDPGRSSGYEFTSQLYFDEALSAAIAQKPEYASNSTGRCPNARDSIFRRGGDQLTLAVEEVEGGLAASFAIGLQY
ncbi:MAG: intradiol ring-cleavage dioxygenase [Bacteroidota bacterium]|nr:intradiol ring-cleavage dioxygenase [Bacteroidota bacterium]